MRRLIFGVGEVEGVRASKTGSTVEKRASRGYTLGFVAECVWGLNRWVRRVESVEGDGLFARASRTDTTKRYLLLGDDDALRQVPYLLWRDRMQGGEIGDRAANGTKEVCVLG
jgi:hypothetical protein